MASLTKDFYDSYIKYKDSKNTLNQVNAYNNAYKNQPAYNDSYAERLENMYSNIAGKKDIDVTNNDAYKQYAAQANALSGLAIAGNQSYAQSLTGGYGSTYAPSVARQGINRAVIDNSAAQPNFALATQNINEQETDRLVSAAGTAANTASNELNDYQQRLRNANDFAKSAYERYSDEKNRAYSQYLDNQNYAADRYWNSVENNNTIAERAMKNTENERSYEMSSYDTYNDIAANKCAEYRINENNDGMKSYLDGLVSAGKITQYMADNLYNKYEYTPSERSYSSYETADGSGYEEETVGYDDNIPKGIRMQVSMNRTKEGQKNTIKRLFDSGKISKEQANQLAFDYKFASKGEEPEWL